MKNSKLFFILCLCLIHLTTTIESKEYSKEIIINSLNNYECSQIEEKYKINISITKKGFDTKEAIKFRLKEPSYAEIECEVPESSLSNVFDLECHVDIKTFPLFDYYLEFPVDSIVYNDIMISFSEPFVIESIFCSPSYVIKFSLFEETINYICKSNKIEIKGNLDGTSKTLSSIVTSFLADNTLQKDFDSISYTKQSSDKYTISFNLQKRYNNITFFNTLGKINGNSALFDIPHYTYKINCPNKSSYIFNKMKWLFLIILTVL